jgi:hypothetical protein
MSVGNKIFNIIIYMDYGFKKNHHDDALRLPKFRILVLGNSEVGKTSIIDQFVNNHFRDTYCPTKEIKYIVSLYCIVYIRNYSTFIHKEVYLTNGLMSRY